MDHSLIIIKEADMKLMAELLNWINEEWMPANGYDPKLAFMRNTPQGYYELFYKEEEPKKEE